MDENKTRKSATKTLSGSRTSPLKPKTGLEWATRPRPMLVEDLCWPWCPGSSVPEIIAHYQAENEPSGADRALQRTADLRFSDTRVAADRDFNHAVPGQGAF